MIGLQDRGRFPPIDRDSIWVREVHSNSILPFLCVSDATVLPNPVGSRQRHQRNLTCCCFLFGVGRENGTLQSKGTCKFDYLVSCSPELVEERASPIVCPSLLSRTPKVFFYFNSKVVPFFFVIVCVPNSFFFPFSVDNRHGLLIRRHSR